MCHYHLAGRSKRKAASRGHVLFAFVLNVYGFFVFRHFLILTLRLWFPQKRQLDLWRSCFPGDRARRSDCQEHNHERRLRQEVTQ